MQTKNQPIKQELLHDIGGIVNNNKRIEVANLLNIPLLSEELEFPMIIHQKISKVIAGEVFLIKDKPILSAIECHTTLKNNPSILDKIVFVADKIEWDQKGIPPYIYDLNSVLEDSLDSAAYVYVNYLMERKDNLKVVHPWLEESFNYFRSRNH